MQRSTRTDVRGSIPYAKLNALNIPLLYMKKQSKPTDSGRTFTTIFAVLNTSTGQHYLYYRLHLTLTAWSTSGNVADLQN